MRVRSPIMSADRVGTIAALGLAYLADEPSRLMSFMTTTGLTPDALRERAGDSDLDAAIIDFLIRDESLLLAFSAHARIEPTEISAAHAFFAGSE